MGRNLSRDLSRLPVAFSFSRGLPPGMRQKDCDGASHLANASATRLWAACTPAQQESLSAQFANRCVEFVRDAILDLEDTSTHHARAAPNENQRTTLADLLWSSWIRFRNRALHQMQAHGEFK